MTSNYVLLASAEADLRGIIAYTRKHWGDAQARQYVATLGRCIEGIAIGAGSFKDMAEIYPGLRMAHCEHHYIWG